MIGILAAGVLVALSLALYELGVGDVRAVLTLLAVTGLFLGLHFRARLPRILGIAWVALLPVMAVGFALESVQRFALYLRQLPHWDYLGFWVHARTAVLGRDFYDPRNAYELAAPFEVNEAFHYEIVNSGFWYPPPTMFLFLPLGLGEPAAMLPWWYAAQVLAAVAAIFMLRRRFFPGGGVVEGVACAALLCATHGTYETIHFAQTNFIALLLVLLFWTRSATFAGGAWLATALFVKPFVALMLLGPAFARQWRSVLGFAAAAVAWIAAAAIAFGAGAFARWIQWDLHAAKPAWIYSQPTNQSLLGLVLRFTGAECQGFGCIGQPLFLAGGAALTVVTVALAAALTRVREHEWTLALILLLALILYPVSQLFYTVLLLPPALLAWQRRDRMPGGGVVLAVTLGLVFALTAHDRGRESVFAFLLMWTVLVVVGVRLARSRGAIPAAGVKEAASVVA